MNWTYTRLMNQMTSYYLYSECVETLKKPLGILFEILLEECGVPPEWRRANIVSIFQKGDRPVALN